MRQLCFGGSFNPIHHGHLICARAAAEAAGFDGVVLIPNANPPHKNQVGDIAVAQHRLKMCQLAVAGDPFFAVNDIELARGGPSFTIDTATMLRTRGWSEVHWLIGADMVPTLPQWHQPDALLREVRFIVMARPDFELDWANLPAQLRALQSNVVKTPLVNISATDIRRRVAAGRSIEYLAPRTVVEYIHQNRLYHR